MSDVPVNLPQTANTDRLAHVDVASDGSGADVEPVNVLGRQLLGVYALLDRSPSNVQHEGYVREVLTVSTHPARR